MLISGMAQACPAIDCCVTSGKLLDFSGPSFLTGLLWGFELTHWLCLGRCLAHGTLNIYHYHHHHHQCCKEGNMRLLT